MENFTKYWFETTFNKSLMGCGHPSNAHKILKVFIWVPNELAIKDDHVDITTFIESSTGWFVLDLGRA